MTTCPESGCTVSRRGFLGAAAALAGAGVVVSAGARLSFAAGPPRGDLLVVVALRGGADGLSLVPPVGDPHLAVARPGIAVRPGQALRLDRTFGLHPRMAPLLPFWQDGRLAVVPAVGDAGGTRSHFVATTALEHGVAEGPRASGTPDGWLDRHLRSRGDRPGAFPAVTIGARGARSLAGPAPDLAFHDVDGVRLRSRTVPDALLDKALTAAHRGVAGPVATASLGTLDAVRRLAPARRSPYVPRAGVRYPEGDLGRALQQVARVARAGVGLEVACVDAGGWDTHEGMGAADGGAMSDLVGRTAEALAAFARDLGPLLATTTVVTVSEFGRRVAENGSGGTDHGLGGTMLLLGGGVVGGRVHGRWPGLAPGRLVAGDVPVTTDYRDVLAEVVRKRLGNARTGEVFPGHRPRELGLLRAR